MFARWLSPKIGHRSQLTPSAKRKVPMIEECIEHQPYHDSAKSQGAEPPRNVQDGPKGVGGWLELFCVGLTILSPFYLMALIAVTWITAEPEVMFENLGFVTLGIYGFVVGCTVWSGSPSGRRIAKQYLVIRFFGSTSIELVAFIMPSTIASGVRGTINVFLGEAVYFLIWWFYFKKSKRVRNTYGHEFSPIFGKPDARQNPAKAERESVSFAANADRPPENEKGSIFFGPGKEPRPLADERITSQPHAASSPANNNEWHIIHAGKQLGPLSLIEVVTKAVVGEIAADDLVRQANGMWAKARDYNFLQQQFLLNIAGKEGCQRTIDKPAHFHGVGKWVSLKDLLFVSCLCLVIVGLWWAYRPTRDAFYYVNRGMAWSNNKDYDKAIEDYDEAIRLDPKDAWAFLFRGNAWLNKNKYDKAIADYDEAIRLDLKETTAFHNRGIAWFNKSDNDKAIQDFDETIRLDPKCAAAFCIRGDAWVRKDDYDKAIKDLTEAIRLDQKQGIYYLKRGALWSFKKKYDKAIQDLDRAIRLDPTEAEAYYWRGCAWSAKENNDKANEDFDEARRLKTDVKLFMKSDGSACIRGTIHNKTGKKVEKLKLSIKTARWERDYDVKVHVENNTSATFSVFVADELLEVESFKLLGVW
jgi:tetratricopeptide (TPR) repeat protein